LSQSNKNHCRRPPNPLKGDKMVSCKIVCSHCGDELNGMSAHSFNESQTVSSKQALICSDCIELMGAEMSDDFESFEITPEFRRFFKEQYGFEPNYF